MVTVNRQSLTYTLGTSPPSLLFESCQGLTNDYRSCSSQPITWLHNCVATFAMTSSALQVLLGIFIGKQRTAVGQSAEIKATQGS